MLWPENNQLKSEKNALQQENDDLIDALALHSPEYKPPTPCSAATTAPENACTQPDAASQTRNIKASNQDAVNRRLRIDSDSSTETLGSNANYADRPSSRSSSASGQQQAAHTSPASGENRKGVQRGVKEEGGGDKRETEKVLDDPLIGGDQSPPKSSGRPAPSDRHDLVP